MHPCSSGWRVRIDYLTTQPGPGREFARAVWEQHLETCPVCRGAFRDLIEAKGTDDDGTQEEPV